MSSTDLTLLVITVVLVVVLIVQGRRRAEPPWVIGGSIAGMVTLFIGVRWAAGIGADAFWAAMVVAIGIAVWGQTEFLWWRRRGSG